MGASDNRLIIYLNEHWYQALLGHGAWRNMQFFYPTQDTLGRSDSFLLWQVLYTPLRALGADPYLAFQLTLIGLSAFGFATFYLLARAVWSPPIWVGLVAAFVFTFSSSLASHTELSSLLGIWLVPSIGLLGWHAWRSAEGPRRRGIVLGAVFGLYTMLVMFTTYYVCYLALIALCIAVLLSLVFTPRVTYRIVSAKIRAGWAMLLAALAGACIGSIPLLLVYLPELQSSGGWPFSTIEYFHASWKSIFDVGTDNVIWSPLLKYFVASGSPVKVELSYGVTPLLLAIVVVGAVYLSVRERRGPRPIGERRYGSAILALTALILMILPIETWFGLPWRWVYDLPGASGIRAIGRIDIIANMLFALLLVPIGIRVAVLIRIARHRVGVQTVAALIVVLLCVGQVNGTSLSQLSRSTELNRLALIHRPPRSCTSFFVTSTKALGPQNLETTAMLVSQRFGLATINGYSGTFPKGWGLYLPTGENYRRAAYAWATAHHITKGLCSLELTDRRWTVIGKSRAL
jgi:hypothetical protein